MQEVWLRSAEGCCIRLITLRISCIKPLDSLCGKKSGHGSAVLNQLVFVLPIIVIRNSLSFNPKP